jgi:hypothetical protein
MSLNIRAARAELQVDGALRERPIHRARTNPTRPIGLQSAYNAIAESRKYGADERTRTADLLITSELRSSSARVRRRP